MNRKLSILELFAGIGGIRLGFESVGGFEFTRAVEISPTARLVYAHRFPSTPIWDDVQSFNGKPGEFDCIIGGSPCQDLSSCRNRAGLDGERSGLWWQQLRIIEECRPKFVGWENVEGALSRGAREVAAGLRMVGYQVEGPVIVSAAELGAPHLRKRIFIVAHRNDLSLRERESFTGWEEQLRNQVAIACNYSYSQSQRRDASGATQVCCDTAGTIGKPAGVGLDDGISKELVRVSVDAPAWLAGIGRSGWWERNAPPDAACTPMQAVPMALRIKYLANL